jgi:hypothetical protein
MVRVKSVWLCFILPITHEQSALADMFCGDAKYWYAMHGCLMVVSVTAETK